MSQASIIAKSEANPSAARLFSARMECLRCQGRRLVELRADDYFVLRREGTLNFACPACGAWNAHRLIRIVL